MSEQHPLTQQEFEDIYSKVPRLTVEIIIRDGDKIYLTKRAIEPCKGQWHLPGGTVRFGEPLAEAVNRIAKRELGITVTAVTNVGIIEYPSHYKEGLDDPVGIVFEVLSYKGTAHQNQEAENAGWFQELPDPMHADQDSFLLENKYIQ